MLLSMTGYGEAHRQLDGVTVAVEARTINNRYFKLALRCAEGYSSLEPEIEAVVRKDIKRGTVQVSLRVDRPVSADDYRLNAAVLEGYRRQLETLARGSGDERPRIAIESLVMMPGVVTEAAAGAQSAADDWPLIRDTLAAALASLAKMRGDEGRTMAGDLRANCRSMADELAAIETRAPRVVESYRGRLQERIGKLLEELSVTLNPADLIREVGIFAERSDISEEIVRLKSHLEQFESIVAHEESPGRKLEFLTQEMLRETNTIGSKANDLEIARRVIEIKASIERVREMVQNVE